MDLVTVCTFSVTNEKSHLFLCRKMVDLTMLLTSVHFIDKSAIDNCSICNKKWT